MVQNWRLASKSVVELYLPSTYGGYKLLYCFIYGVGIQPCPQLPLEGTNDAEGEVRGKSEGSIG